MSESLRTWRRGPRLLPLSRVTDSAPHDKPPRVRRALVERVWGFALVLCGASASPAFGEEIGATLFVGNSLTYVGNLPAVFDAIPLEGQPRPESDMLVAAGATLIQRLDDHSVERALSTGKYEVVVLQERGGDFACGFGPEVCANSRRALHRLARLIRSHGATPILLGTYQADREAAARIEDAESRAARAERVRYVPVARTLLDLRTRHPEMNWFHSDGMHPGSDLTLLEALLLFETVFDKLPAASPISVHAPIFAVKAPPLEVRSASSPTGVTGWRDGIDYDAGRVGALLAAIRE